MNTEKIDHLGIAVESLEESVPFYENALGLKKKGVEEVEEQGVKVAFFEIGESKFELLEPISDDSPIARHIEKRGSGIHHIALKVNDIEAKVKDMEDKGVQFIGDSPSKGAGGKKIIFVHPRSTGGVLLELCE